MEQRRVRLGDIVDDYCPRERRVTNHAVVAMIEDEIRQTRCTACDADHPYKAARIPRGKKRDASAPPAALPPPRGEAVEAEADESGSGAESVSPQADAAPSPLGLAAAPDVAGEETSPAGNGSGPVGDAREEGPFRRSLIRATLPRPEGQPTARPLPEFTMRQSGVRGGRLIDNEARGNQRAERPTGGQSHPRSERHGNRPEHRHGHGRPAASHGPRFDRPHGQGRGGGHARPGRGGKKRSR